jgi:hypothetical protein
MNIPNKLLKQIQKQEPMIARKNHIYKTFEKEVEDALVLTKIFNSKESKVKAFEEVEDAFLNKEEALKALELENNDDCDDDLPSGVELAKGEAKIFMLNEDKAIN